MKLLGAVLAFVAVVPASAIIGCGRAQQPNVIVVTIDTIRPDHLGWEDYPGARTPNLDQFAAQGAYFWRCFTPAPITLPAHTSIMTGLSPLRHGVRDNGLYRVADETVTLAEILVERGYSTAGFISGYPLKMEFGIAQGFEIYDDDLESDDPYSWDERSMNRGATQMAERPADRTTAAALDWLSGTDEPFFLWIHYFDPHQGYAPPPPYSDIFHDKPYDGEIAFVDEQFGRVMARLKELGIDGETAVVVAGDHGEGLGDHGELTHAMLTYDSTLRVPLLMSLPGATRPAQSVHHDVGLIDIVPTLLDYLGIDTTMEYEGLSLLDLLSGQPLPSRPLYFESEAGANVFGWARIDGVRFDGWKLIQSTRSELYNVVEDPNEQLDLSDHNQDMERQLGSLLDAVTIARQQAESVHEASRVSASDETREQLAALGYLSGTHEDDTTGHQTETDELIHPLDHIWVINEWSRLRDDVASERLTSAESRLRYLTAYDPMNPDFKSIQGMIYAKTGRESEAQQVWEELVSRGIDRVNVLQNLGQLYSRTGQPDRALELYEVAVGKASHDPSIQGLLLVRIAEMRQKRGEPDEALEALRRVAELRPRDPEVLRRQAAIHYRTGNTKQAEELLHRSLEVNPYYSRSYQNLAALNLDLGEIEKALSYARRCVTLSPEYPEGRYILAVALAENEEQEEAIRILREMTESTAKGSLMERARQLLAELER
jgi:arylsulfatase A-like enzyme/Flp pilus assembly protein TadD